MWIPREKRVFGVETVVVLGRWVEDEVLVAEKARGSDDIAAAAWVSFGQVWRRVRRPMLDALDRMF